MTPAVVKAPTCYCGSPTRLRESKHGPFYGCTRWPECDGTVGCHPGTTKPLGTPADKATKAARIKAHEALDALWEPMEKERRRYRDAAYRMLAEELDIDEPHIGEMDEATALRVVEVCEGLGPEDLEEWLS